MAGFPSKSMLLKLLYAMTAVASERRNPVRRGAGADSWPGDLPGRLRGVFNVDSISSLTTRGQRPTRLSLTLDDGSDLVYEFSDDEMPGDGNVFLDVGFRRPRGFPVFIPAHEILSVAHGLRSLFVTYEVPFDETWNDLATLLYGPPAQGSLRHGDRGRHRRHRRRTLRGEGGALRSPAQR